MIWGSRSMPPCQPGSDRAGTLCPDRADRDRLVWSRRRKSLTRTETTPRSARSPARTFRRFAPLCPTALASTWQPQAPMPDRQRRPDRHVAARRRSRWRRPRARRVRRRVVRGLARSRTRTFQRYDCGTTASARPFRVSARCASFGDPRLAGSCRCLSPRIRERPVDILLVWSDPFSRTGRDRRAG